MTTLDQQDITRPSHQDAWELECALADNEALKRWLVFVPGCPIETYRSHRLYVNEGVGILYACSKDCALVAAKLVEGELGDIFYTSDSPCELGCRSIDQVDETTICDGCGWPDDNLQRSASHLRTWNTNEAKS